MRRALALLALLRAANAVLVGDRVSYLAFGSNMHPAVLTRKRGVEPLLQLSPAVGRVLIPVGGGTVGVRAERCGGLGASARFC